MTHLTKVTHHSQAFRGLGGVESVLKHHHEVDRKHGMDSSFVIYHEPRCPPVERVSFLDLGKRNTIRQARKRLRESVSQAPPEVAAYHTALGMTYLSDLDGSNRRILIVHSDPPGLDTQLQLRSHWVDGALCVSEPLRRRVAKILAHLETERVGLICCPISPRGGPLERSPLNGRPMVLGVCGRLIVEQKRVDRLPALCAHLDQAGLNYRFEFLGRGPEESWLKSQLTDRTRVVFHGMQTGDDYWRILNGWDVIVFVSDYEGIPLSLLEAMSVGVIPIYPRIESGGDAYAEAVRPDFLYEPGDLGAIAARLKNLSALTPTEMAELRIRSKDAVQRHVGDNYISTFARFVHQIAAAPRAARAPFPKRPWPVDDLPLSWVARLGLFRRACLRLMGR